MTAHKTPNKLIYEKSPYLQQHAYNPVNWHAWNEETLKLAKAEEKPIFLSIGYSTCYWCHVMERECFEDEGIAKLLNDTFINIKVDREERPDIDRTYMSALQSLTGSGGWPMSIFITPELKPFYAATYIPPKAKYGRSGLEDIIAQISELWQSRRSEIYESADKVFQILDRKSYSYIDESRELSADVFGMLFKKADSLYDEENGGFGSGNKFPRPAALNFLLTYYYHTKDIRALDIVRYTLKKMRDGGIFDNLEYGFHRYSVDEKWRVPHFEKMLYDQAQISQLYFDAYLITKEKYYLVTAEQTLEYVSSRMTDSCGGFYSAEDAESAPDAGEPHIKEEGYFYLFEKYEIEELLSQPDAGIFCYAYGIFQKGNTIHDPHEVFGTRNVLYVCNDIFDTAKQFGISTEETEESLNRSLKILKEYRDTRTRPSLDRKILTSWNSHIISAFAKGYRVTGNRDYLMRAEKAADFLLKEMRGEDGSLYHRWIEGERKFDASLDDYAFFVKSLLDLYSAGFNPDFLRQAFVITDSAIKKFYDRKIGGFYDSDIRNPEIILKTKDSYDGAEPSGNSVMIENLLRISVLTGEKGYKEIAEKSLKQFYSQLEKSPFNSPYMVSDLYYLFNPPPEIVFTGNINNNDVKEMLDDVNKTFLPNLIIVHATTETGEALPVIKNIVKDFNNINFYICENYKCNLPVNDRKNLNLLLKQIKTLKASGENNDI